MEGCPSGQWEQTVNLPANAFEGSNPSPSTVSPGVDSAIGNKKLWTNEGGNLKIKSRRDGCPWDLGTE